MATQEQLNEVLARLQRLEQDNQRLGAELNASRAETQQVTQALQQQQQQQPGPGLGQGLAAEIARAMRDVHEEERRERGHVGLIDAKGLNKPGTFGGDKDEDKFIQWARKTSNFIASAYRDAREMLGLVTDMEDVVTYEELMGDDVENPRFGRPRLEEIDDQLYVVLSALTTDEAFNIVVSSGEGAGFEAWRRLQRRFDPITAGRKRSLLRDIMDPGRAKLMDLQPSIERLEEMMRRYEARKDANGNRRQDRFKMV